MLGEVSQRKTDSVCCLLYTEFQKTQAHKKRSHCGYQKQEVGELEEGDQKRTYSHKYYVMYNMMTIVNTAMWYIWKLLRVLKVLIT